MASHFIISPWHGVKNSSINSLIILSSCRFQRFKARPSRPTYRSIFIGFFPFSFFLFLHFLFNITNLKWIISCFQKRFGLGINAIVIDILPLYLLFGFNLETCLRKINDSNQNTMFQVHIIFSVRYCIFSNCFKVVRILRLWLILRKFPCLGCSKSLPRCQTNYTIPKPSMIIKKVKR